MHSFRSVLIKGAAILDRVVQLPLSFQPEIMTSGGISDDVKLKTPTSKLKWNTPLNTES